MAHALFFKCFPGQWIEFAKLSVILMSYQKTHTGIEKSFSQQTFWHVIAGKAQVKLITGAFHLGDFQPHWHGLLGHLMDPSHL